MIQHLNILFQNDDFIVIHKPPGMHVHQPEMAKRRVPREITILWTLRRQIDKFLYPVHRLDVATEGVLVMAFQSEVARSLQHEFQEGRVSKRYHAICRGWLSEEGRIEIPLERDSNGTLANAATTYTRLAKVERPFPVGKRYPTARYSLVEARPETGRWHQIRRHFARLSHPIIGDREHGDSHHSRYFRETLGLPGLWLRAAELKFTFAEQDYAFQAPLSRRWMEAGEQLEIDIESEIGQKAYV
jgi:tRNA pseudouridine65 synthase